MDELDQKSKDLERLCEELIQFYRNLMVVKTTPDASAIIPVASEELEQLKGSAEALSLPQILYWLSAFQETFERLSRCSNKRLEIEMLFVRLCSPQLDSRLDGILARLERLEQQLANRSGNAAGPSPQQMVNPDASTEMASPVVPVAEQQESVPLQDAPADLESLIIPEQPEPSVPKSVGPQPLTCWDEVMRDLSEETPMLAGILRGSTALIAGDRLLLQSPNSVFKDTILNKKDLLDAAILRHTGQKYRLMVKTALQKEENKELAQLLDNARKSGIEIEEE